MKKLIRGFSRAIFHTVRLALVPLELVNARIYMKFYRYFLELYGVRFTGTPRYISSRARFDDFSLVSIGERVVISSYVILLTHDYSVTTALIANEDSPSTDVAIRRPITLGKNVFVGMNSIILPGAVIGDNVIIGAGSVVRGYVDGDCIIMGNPAVKTGALSDDPSRWKMRASGPGSTADEH